MFNIVFELKSFSKNIRSDFKNIPIKTFMFIWVLGILFRIVAMDAHECLHIDEAMYSSWAASIGHNHKILFNITEVDKPPVFYYLLAIPIFLLGPNDHAVKIPGLIFGILTIPLVALLAYNLSKNHSSIWAALFYALSPFEIAYSPTVFAEVTCIFFSLCALLGIMYRMPLMAGLLIGLALGTKQTVLYFFPLYIIFYLIRFNDSKKLPEDDLKRLLYGFLISFTPVLIWVLFFSDRGIGIFWAICQKNFFTPASGFQFFEWLKYEKFVTGNFFMLYFSLGVIFLARLLYTKSLLSNFHKDSLKTVLEILSIIFFVAGYYFMISILKYPTYSRYLLVITSPYLVLFGVSMSSVLGKLSEICNKRGIYNFVPVLSVLIALFWVLKTPVELKKFPDGANYNYHEAVKPCFEFIKKQSKLSAVYYTDELWPWAPWYVYAEREKKQILRVPANFRDFGGIEQLLKRMSKDIKDIKKRKVYFIINPDRDKGWDNLFESITGEKPVSTVEFESNPTDKSRPRFSVYSIDTASIMPSVTQN